MMASILSRREEKRALRLAQSQPASAGELLELLEELRDRAIESVLEDERVRARLEGARYRVLAVDFREEEKPAAEGHWPWPLAEVGIYDYDKDLLVVAVFDLRQGIVLDLQERRGVKPPVTDEELEAARSLVSSDHPHYTHLFQPATSAVAFPTPSFLADHARAAHRCVTLYVSPEPGGPEVTEITVDLSAEEMVPDEELIAGSPRFTQGPERGRYESMEG